MMPAAGAPYAHLVMLVDRADDPPSPVAAHCWECFRHGRVAHLNPPHQAVLDLHTDREMP